MTFWNVSGEKALQPKRNYRFRLTDGDQELWWWAKTVDKPSFDVSSNEYQLINHKFKYPGILTWKPIYDVELLNENEIFADFILLKLMDLTIVS